VPRLCDSDDVQRVVEASIATAVQSVSFSSAGGSCNRRSAVGRSKSRLGRKAAYVTDFTEYSGRDDRANPTNFHQRGIRLTYKESDLSLQGLAFGIQCEKSFDPASAEIGSAALIIVDQRLRGQKGTSAGEHSTECALIARVGDGQVSMKTISDPGALVEELVSVVDQELEILRNACLAYWWQVWFAEHDSSDRQRVTWIRLAARAQPLCLSSRKAWLYLSHRVAGCFQTVGQSTRYAAGRLHADAQVCAVGICPRQQRSMPIVSIVERPSIDLPASMVHCHRGNTVLVHVQTDHQHR
jgi:hypothetical protein